MEKMILLLIGLSIATGIKSQNNESIPKKHEFLIGTHNVFNLRAYPQSLIGYKHHGKLNTFRSSLILYMDHEKFLSASQQIVETSSSSYLLRTGIERHLTKSRFNFFYGFDLGAGYSDNYNFNLLNGELEGFKDVKTAKLGIFPLVGFEFKVLPWLYISTENSLNLYYEIKFYKDVEKPIGSFSSKLTPLGNLMVGIRF